MQIQKIALLTNDLAAMEAFYHGVLGLSVLEKTRDAIAFRIGYSMLTFKHTSDPVGIYHFAILIPTNTVVQAHQWLQQRTPILPFDAAGDIADFTNWNAQAFYFHDPQQNIVELIAHHNLPLTWEGSFSAEAMIGICEIGVVVDDVAAACKRLHTNQGMPFFSKGPYLKDFAVMGEEDGLMILSAIGRGWLPTGQQATPNSFEVTFSLNGQLHFMYD